MPDISVMLKPASSACNMRCKYCFYHDVADMREQFGYGMMGGETARAVIDSAIKTARGGSVYFAFQGGEPLLAGKEFFKDFFSYTDRKKGGVKIYYAMQTNGTLIDEEWADMFAKNNVLVGLSLDGSAEDNFFRLRADYTPAFNDAMRAADILKKRGAHFNILTVVTGKLADNIERVYEFFAENGFKYLQFIPCLRPFGSSEESELYMTNEQYARFLITLFRLYAKDYLSGNYVSIRRFDNWVRLYRGEKFEECGVGGFCGRQFVVEGNGNVYPCDFYCLDEWLLGNINERGFDELAHSAKSEEFIRSSLIMPEKCRGCGYFPMCRGGGCKRARTSYDYCNAYKLFFASSKLLFDKISRKMSQGM